MLQSKKYQIAKYKDKREKILIKVNGKYINLGTKGAFTSEPKGSKTETPKPVKYFAPSEKDLDAYYKKGKQKILVLKDKKDSQTDANDNGTNNGGGES